MGTVKPHETKILEAFWHLYYLTAQQVTDLLYSPKSFETVSKTLLRLADPEDKYLLRARPFDDALQNVPFIYYLATKGRNHLITNGYDFTGWRYPSDMKDFIKSSHLPHCLGVNDFLILAHQFVKQHPEIKLIKFLHDFTINKILQTLVRPDGLLHFLLSPDTEAPNGYEASIWLEYDRKSEKEQAWRDKMKRIVELMYYGFDQAFSSPLDTFTFAVVTPFGEHRLGELLLWTERQLTEMNQKQLGGKFLFYALPENSDAKEVFLDMVWNMPFTTEKYRLLEI